MATLGGAKAMQLDGHIGSLDVGKHADGVLHDTDRMTTVDESELYAKAQQMGEAITLRSGLPDKAKFPMR